MNLFGKVFPNQFEFLSHPPWRFFSTPQPMDSVMRAPSGPSREGLQCVEACGKLGIHQSVGSSCFSSRE